MIATPEQSEGASEGAEGKRGSSVFTVSLEIKIVAKFKLGETVFFWHGGVMFASPVLRASRLSVTVAVRGRRVRLPWSRVGSMPRRLQKSAL